MGVHHFTFEPTKRVYTVHFDPPAAAKEVDDTLWSIGSHWSLVEAAATEAAEGVSVVRFNFYGDHDPSEAMSRLRRELAPRLPYTLQSLRVTSIQERCGRHNATHIRALFWDGLVPLDVGVFAHQLTSGLLEPRGMGLQLRRDRKGLVQEATRLHEAIGAYQQGITDVVFSKANGPCPDCNARMAPNN